MSNVIGDIAGQYNTLLALLKKMPDEEVISLGDMIDRGPRSKEVLDFFMEPGRRAILGNHEHLMMGHFSNDTIYDPGIWEYNGGLMTLAQFAETSPLPYLEWFKTLPLYLEVDDCLISHAFLHQHRELEEACELNVGWSHMEKTIIWSREYPIRRPQWKRQIAGHNSQFGLKHFSDKKGEFAVCIDTSSSKVLTGINTKTLKVYQQEYID